MIWVILGMLVSPLPNSKVHRPYPGSGKMEISNISIHSTRLCSFWPLLVQIRLSELLRSELPTYDIGDDSRKIPDPEWPFFSISARGYPKYCLKMEVSLLSRLATWWRWLGVNCLVM